MARTKKKVKYNYQKVAVILGAVLLFFTFIVGLSNAPFPKADDPYPMGGYPGGISVNSGITPNLATNPSYLQEMLRNTWAALTTGFTGFNTVAPQPATCISDNQSCNNGTGTCQRVKRTSCESQSGGDPKDENNPATKWHKANRICQDLPGTSGCSDFKRGCNSIGNPNNETDGNGNPKYNEARCNNSNVNVAGVGPFQACKFGMVDVMQDGKPKYECKPQVVIAHTCSTILNYKECNFGVGLRLGCTWEEIAPPTCNGPYCPVYFRAPEPAGRCIDKPKEIDRCRSIETMKECEFGVGVELGCSWIGALPGGPEACYSSDNPPA